MMAETEARMSSERNVAIAVIAPAVAMTASECARSVVLM